MLVYAGLAPVVFVALGWVVLPNASAWVGAEVACAYPFVVAGVVVFTPSLYGFVVGIFLLEDREQGMLSALRLTPLVGGGYLHDRGATTYILSAPSTFLAVLVIDLLPVSPTALVGSVAVSALSGPLVALLFVTVADNTVEGLVLTKFLGLPLLAPVLAVAFVPEPLALVAGISPTYWPTRAVVAGITGEGDVALSLAVGTAYSLALLGLLVRSFVRRAD